MRKEAGESGRFQALGEGFQSERGLACALARGGQEPAGREVAEAFGEGRGGMASQGGADVMDEGLGGFVGVGGGAVVP